MNRFALHKMAVSSSALQMYRRLMGVPCAPVSYVHRRMRSFKGFSSRLADLNFDHALSRESLSRIGLDSRGHEPNPCRDLKREVESKGCLISDFWIVSSLRRPMLKHDAGRVLHNESHSDVEQIQRPVGPPGQLFRKILGQNRKAEHRSRADRRHNGPLQI